VREIRTLRATWRALETGPRKFLNGHEGGNAGYSQGASYGLPRQRSTLPQLCDPGGSDARGTRSGCRCCFFVINELP
jgi:hypothetical protein